MADFYNIAMAVMWLTWSAYWWMLSRNVKVTVHKEPFYSRLSYTLPILLAGILLFTPEFPVAGLNDHFLPVSAWRIYGGIGVALTFTGLHDARKFASYTFPVIPDSNVTHLYFKIASQEQFLHHLEKLAVKPHVTDEIVVTVADPDGRKVMFGTA